MWQDDEFLRSAPPPAASQVAVRPPEPVLAPVTAAPIDDTPPEISLQRGINIVATSRHTLRGVATDVSGVAIVELNGIEASLDASGNFAGTVLLKPGENRIYVTATDVFNNRAIKEVVMTREAGAIAAAPAAASPRADQLSVGDYHALIIAVQDYRDANVADLSGPVNDTERLRQVLIGNYTFEPGNVTVVTNPTRGDLLDQFDRLAETLTEKDNLLIFYAGHGYWDERTEQGYWLPADANQRRRRAWIANGTIVDYINGIQTKHTLLVSDACFSGGIFKTRSAFNDMPTATDVLYRLPSRKAMTSGTLTEVPDKSVFIDYLIKRLENNDSSYLTSQQLFASFRTAVINNSPTRQIPQFGEIREAGDEGGDFIFVRR